MTKITVTNPPSTGGAANLPQGLSTTDTPSFDQVFVTRNGTGQNIMIGDDAWIGDVNQGNMFSVIGVQDGTQGGIVLGNQLTEQIHSDGSNLNLQASSKIKLNSNLLLDNYRVLEFNDNSNNQLGRIYTDNNLILEGQQGISIASYNGYPAYFQASQAPVILNGDSGEFLNDSNVANNQIATLGDIHKYTGTFHDENSFGPYTANSEHPMSYETTDWSDGVHIGGINNEQITIDNAGKYNIQFSAQFHNTSGGSIIYVWLKQNGTSIPWSNTRVDMSASNPYAVTAWNWFVNAAQNDYYEIWWSSTSANTKLEAVTGLTGTKPNIPSVILTVNQVG